MLNELQRYEFKTYRLYQLINFTAINYPISNFNLINTFLGFNVSQIHVMNKR